MMAFDPDYWGAMIRFAAYNRADLITHVYEPPFQHRVCYSGVNGRVLHAGPFNVSAMFSPREPRVNDCVWLVPECAQPVHNQPTPQMVAWQWVRETSMAKRRPYVQFIGRGYRHAK